MKKPSLNLIVIIALSLSAMLAVGLVVWLFQPTRITVTNVVTGKVSPITGLTCSDLGQRPVAIMLASDPEARPLSGLGEADMVFEMPVTPNGITRLMAVYQCGPKPTELGSVRSARQDFIPLAQGLDAIFAHWGGEAGALEELNDHIIDNVDALVYEGTTFYRKKGIPAPHNGFTTLDLIRSKAQDLGYAASSSLSAYPHLSNDSAPPNISSLVDSVSLSWPQGMNVKFDFDPTSNRYLRWRGGTPEIDKTTSQQVSVAVVVDMKTTSSFLRDQYINVSTLGTGPVIIYQNGTKISGTWKKASAKDMLTFVDDKGVPIPLATGPIWVLVDAPLPQP